MPRGKTLSRQIASYLASDTAETDLGRLQKELRSAAMAGTLPPGLATAYQSASEPFGKLPELFDIVEETYLKYQDNLDIAERNVTLSSSEMMLANQAINAMVNCLGQGFLIFDRHGICAPVYSKACETLLETAPAGKPIATVLQLDQAQTANFDFLLGLAFGSSAAMSFSEIMKLAPRRFVHSQGLHIQLDYRPEMSDGRLSRIVLVVTDMTREIIAQKLAEEKQAAFEALERILLDRAGFGTYMRHAAEFVQDLKDMLSAGNLTDLRREAHTLKAGAGMFRLYRLTGLLHDFEQALNGLTETDLQAGPESLTLHQNYLQAEVARITRRVQEVLGLNLSLLEHEAKVDKATLYDFARHLQAAGQAQLMRDFLLSVCAEPLWDRLRPLDALAGDLAERFNKRVAPINFAGENPPILREHYNAFFEALTHLFRNILDHGIEDPDTRQRLGKPAAGRIDITTYLRTTADGHDLLVLQFSDDGGGVDIERLRNKLAASDLTGDWLRRSEADLLNQLLTHNISVRDTITHYSGRGLGLGAVYHEVMQLGGTMRIRSTPHRGTCFDIELPYRLELP